MSGSEQPDKLRDWAVDRLRPTLDGVGYIGACRGVAALMTERLGADVAVRFVTINGGLSGGTARCADGRYIVYCAKSRSWYHRLGILLHELAHVLLGHRPVELTTRESLRRFLPSLPDSTIELIAGRTELAAAEERDAEALADSILALLTDTIPEPEQPDLGNLPDHVRRIAEALGDNPRQEDR